MDIRFQEQYNPELDCFIMLHYRYANEQSESAVNCFLEQLAQSRGLPMEELRVIAAPAAALERHIMERLSAPEQLLRYYFPPACEQNGEIGLSFWKLRSHGIRFRDLPPEELERHKRSLLRDVAGLGREQIDRVTDIDSLLTELDKNCCTDHALRVSLDIYRDPVSSQENYDRILDEAVELYRQKESLLPEPGEYSLRFLRQMKENEGFLFRGLRDNLPAEAVCYCYPTAFHFLGKTLIINDLYTPIPEAVIAVGAFDDKIEELQQKYNSVVPDLTIKLKAISDQRRMEILGALRDGARRVEDLTSRFSMSPALLSYHLDQLYRVNLLSIERKGRVNHYSLNYPVLQHLVRSLKQYLWIQDIGFQENP